MKSFYCFFGNRNQIVNKVGTLLWDDPFLWIEDCSVEEIVLWDEGSNRVMIFGDVLATEQECKKIYTKYREKQNLSVWAKLAGNTTTILYEDNKTTFIPDPCQLRPIFYVVENNCILVSTSRLGIKRMLSVSIDKKSVAMSLMCAGMTELSHHFSLLNKVKIIPSHHAMIVTSSGVELIPVRFSCKEEKTLKEGASELRQKLVSSTKRRLNRYPHQSCDFSGGLDSTSLALLAARYSSHKVDSITFSSISEEEDVKIALKSLEDQSNIRHHLFKSSELPLPYHRLNEAPLLDEPLSFLFMWSQIEKGLKCAKSVSSDLHLTGDGGDNVLQSSDVYVSSLFNWNVFPLFFSHLRKWARKRNQSPLSQIIQALRFRFTSYSSWLNKQIHQKSFFTNSKSTWHWSGILFCGDWITKEAKEWVIETLQEEIEKLNPLHSNPSIHSNWTSLFHTASVARLTQQLGESLNVKIQFPYLDPSIVQTCFHVHSYERSHPEKFKFLLKEALNDVLPPVLLNRTSKGNYTPDLFYGFQQHYHEIHELFCNSILAKYGIIDLPLFYQAIEKMRAGIHVGLWELNMTIAMELWLQQVKRSECVK